MRDHGAVTRRGGGTNRRHGLGEGTDLVRLDEDRVGDAVAYAPSKCRGIRYEQIVAHQLDAVTESRRQRAPAQPVVFVQGIFYGDDREVVQQSAQVIGESIRVQASAFSGQPIGPGLVELGGGAVERQENVASQLVARQFHRFRDHGQGRRIGVEIRCETAFVPHRRRRSPRLERLLESVENLDAAAQRLGEGAGPYGHHHELLDVDVVVRVGTTVDDVHHRHGQAHIGTAAVEVSQVDV